MMNRHMKLLVLCIIVVLLGVLFMGYSCEDDSNSDYFIINSKTNINQKIMPGDSIEIVIDVKNISGYTMSFYPMLTVESENERLLSMLTFTDGLVQKNGQSITVEYGSVTMESQSATQFIFKVNFSTEITNEDANSTVNFVLNYYRKNETLAETSKVLVNISKKIITIIIGGAR